MKPKAWIVAWGDIRTGIRFFGPFKSEGLAIRFEEKELESFSSYIVPVYGPRAIDSTSNIDDFIKKVKKP